MFPKQCAPKKCLAFETLCTVQFDDRLIRRWLTAQFAVSGKKMKKTNSHFQKLRQLLNQFASSELGAMQVAEYLLMGTVITLGVLVGLVSYRDALVLEYGDIATAFQRIDQGYSYTINGTTYSYTDTGSSGHTNTISVTTPSAAGEN